MNNIKKLLVLFLLATIVYSCSKDDSVETYIGYEYFPTNVGHWIEYDVDSIIKDDFTGHSDTFHFQLREEIDSIFIDNSGAPTQRLERFKRQTLSDPWIIHKVWTSNLSNTTAQKVEDNIRYLKLVFPVSLFTNWDGNAFNTKDQADYEYTEVHQQKTVNGLNFDSSLTVIQIVDTNNLLSDVIEIEQYATQVGMIYKEQQHIERDFNFDTIVSAFVYIEKIRAYGN